MSQNFFLIQRRLRNDACRIPRVKAEIPVQILGGFYFRLLAAILRSEIFWLDIRAKTFLQLLFSLLFVFLPQPQSSRKRII